MVFDARTGAPVSLNREARRIVDGLCNPDQSAEDLLATLTVRRAVGREISLRDFPLAQALSTGETIRAEEIVIQVPDGRRITTIINATPIPRKAGGGESVIVTMQDMTSLEELERLRAEFLGMVSHELRAPLTSIRGSADTAPLADEVKRIALDTPQLTQPQLTGLVLWVCGAVLAGSACQNAVASALSPWGRWNNVRQYLREWLYDGSDRARPCQTELDVSLCFAPLLRWVLAWWPSGRLALAVDPTLKGDQTTAIVISVVYRGCAIPVAWHIHRATQRGSWMDPTVELLMELAPAVPKEMTVIVLSYRGIASPKLWRQIRAQGWHPYIRYRKNVRFCAQDGRRLPAQHFVSRPDTAWIGRGTAFSTPNAKRRCTLLAVWYVEQEEPWIILTDLPTEDAGPSWYALRFWIELGFKAVKSLGWKWDKTRRTDPARISRHWLVLSVATLLALAYGTRVEDAHDRRIAPGILRTPPKACPVLDTGTPTPSRRDPWGRPVRTVSVIRHGIDWLRRLLLRGRLWSRVWLLPEPWPEPKPNLEVTHHAPS